MSNETQNEIESSRMVKNVVADWQQMAGESEDIRRLNSLLTSTFFGDDIPADECLDEARTVMEMYLADEGGTGDWKKQVRDYLVSQFAEDDEGRLLSTAMRTACEGVVPRIEKVITTGRWPDKPVVV